MPLSSVEAPYHSSTLQRYEQGDILRDVDIVEWAERVGDQVEFLTRHLPYCVVVSQECDLEHDSTTRGNPEKNADKYLHSILLCPAYPADQLKAGQHLDESSLQMEPIDKSRWRKVEQNGDARYHYLPEQQQLQVPSLVIDFKHYLTVPRDVLYRKEFLDRYIATVEILYRELLSARFAQFLSRIGLPDFSSP